MRWRRVNRIIAWLGRYFWLPCAKCHVVWFGGHEWHRWNYATTPEDEWTGVATCRVCASAPGGE